METVYFVLAQTSPTRTEPEGSFAGSVYLVTEAGLDGLPDGVYALYPGEREDITQAPVLKSAKNETLIKPAKVIERKTPKTPATRVKDIELG